MMAHRPGRRTAAAFCAGLALAAGGAAGEPARWNESAYCVGVLRHTQQALVRLGTPAEVQRHADRLAARSAVIRESIGWNGTDAVRARELMALGRADAESCWDRMDVCLDRGAADPACMAPAQQSCVRVSVCSR